MPGNTPFHALASLRSFVVVYLFLEGGGNILFDQTCQPCSEKIIEACVQDQRASLLEKHHIYLCISLVSNPLGFTVWAIQAFFAFKEINCGQNRRRTYQILCLLDRELARGHAESQNLPPPGQV